MIYINPHRGHGEMFLIYTLHEGGEFHAIRFSHERYVNLLRTGQFKTTTGDTVSFVKPAFSVLVKGVDGFDFMIERYNKEYV